jgi:asparagine synthase (glutamine-hydrolysing)
MCRIVGGINFDHENFPQDTLTAMTNSLIHGGPDGGGTLINENVGFGHRRLSIIDLSDAASQPMENDNWIITFNGEIYNFKEIKNILKELGTSFKTNSDTEVIIASFDCWGKEAVAKFRGMFAFALFNKQNRVLTLCRDRFGVKPLYTYNKNNIFLFSSEIRAFHQHEKFDKSLDLSGLPHFFQKGYFDSDSCIFKYVSKLKPGTFLDIFPSGKMEHSKYWNPKDFYGKAKENKSLNEVLNNLEKQLIESFKLRLVSDVKVGIFLSGGIDSSLVIALLQKDLPKPIRTYTIGFKDEDYNEADIASEIAAQIGTNHSTLYCKSDDFIDIIPLLPEIYDEPFGDASAIPTYLVSSFARKDVKVVLSGDGGDELFGGYLKYIFGIKAKGILKIPFFLRNILYGLLLRISSNHINTLSNIPGLKKIKQFSNRFFKFREVLLSRNIDDLMDRSSNFLSAKDVEIFTGKKAKYDSRRIRPEKNQIMSYFGLKDIDRYLPNDILTKVDRSSMSLGLEAREPFLDPEIIDFSFKLDDSFKYNKSLGGKFLLKKILEKYVDPKLINRPKQGFTIPLEDWLKGFLKLEIFSIENDIKFFQVFDLDRNFYGKVIRSFYNNKGRYNPYFIWFVYCLYNWKKKWLGK